MEKDIVELIKERVLIEDVIAEDGYPLPTRGRYRKCTTAHIGGLVVDTQRQSYYWNVRAEGGDVIQWVINQRTHDFKAACEELARRFGFPAPEWGRQDHAQRLAARVCQDALEVASQVLQRWFWADQAVQDYVRGRGFSLTHGELGEEVPSTAVLARLGYTGGGGDAQRREMIEALKLNGVELESPVAMAILGYHGDVAGWARAHQLELSDDWVTKKYIPGLLDHPRLCYPHIEHGQVKYISTRSIGEKFHYNLPEALVGKRRMYFNHQWGAVTNQVVICEGQADAITWGQWGIPAVALAGVMADEDLGELLKPYQAVYIAMDMDITGITAAWRLALSLGPRVRLVPPRDPGCVLLSLPPDAQPRVKEFYELANQVLTATSAIMRWPFSKQYETFTSGSEEKEVKDSNDILRAFATHELIEEGEQAALAQMLLDRSPWMSELVSSWAGARDGTARETAMRTAASLINHLDDFSMAQQKGRLAKFLQVTMRELERMLKAEKIQSKQNSRSREPILTWGECVNGWLLEYLYNPTEHTSSLAWRDPDGKVGSGPGVEIDGNWYEAFPPNDVMKKSAIIFPSKLGEKKTIKELVTYIQMYLESIYLLPSKKIGRLIAYWVMTTWLYDSFETVIYLRAMGGTGSGKSELMRRIGLVCYRMMTANGAGSTSSLFRSLERYKGTVFIDEADIQNSDSESDMVKFYNLGAMRNNPIWRTIEVTGPDGEKTWEAVSFQTFCPKLVAMRKDFRDDAVGSRSLTMKMTSKEMPELKAAKIPLTINNEVRSRAQAIRNLLLRWRLETWQPEIEVDAEFYDMSISPRLNQVAGPLLAIAKDDQEQQEDIRKMLREYYAETIISQSMTLAARVLEAMWKIWNYPDLHKDKVKQEPDGTYSLKIGDITTIANQIMDEMNDEKNEDSEDGGKSNNRREVKAQRIGRIIREELQLQVSERRRDGFWVQWNEPRIQGLSTKYGINPSDFGPTAIPPQPKQEKLELP